MALWLNPGLSAWQRTAHRNLTPPPVGPTLLFEDHFDGSDLNSANWIKTYYWGADPPRNPSTGEIQTYVPEAITVQDSKAIITVTKETGAPNTYGPKIGTLAVDQGWGDVGGETPWTNPTRAQANNGQYATIVRSSQGASQYLNISGFDFSAMGAAEVIKGVKLEWICKSSAASTYRIDASYLSNDAGFGADWVSDNFTPSGLIVSTTEGAVSAGGSTTLNNATINAAMVKGSGFGVMFTVRKYAGTTSQTFSLNYCQMTIYTENNVYKSGIFCGYNKKAFKYGYIEASIKTPAGGNGMWPAFWMLRNSPPESWPPEFDFEWGWSPNVVHTDVHYGTLPDDKHNIALDVDLSPTNLTAGFHTYAWDWQPDYLRWYVDGVLKKEVTDPAAIPNVEMYPIFNLALGGGGWDLIRSPDGTTVFPSTFEIDYIKWYTAKP